jgi:hypothetical protein
MGVGSLDDLRLKYATEKILNEDSDDSMAFLDDRNHNHEALSMTDYMITKDDDDSLFIFNYVENLSSDMRTEILSALPASNFVRTGYGKLKISNKIKVDIFYKIKVIYNNNTDISLNNKINCIILYMRDLTEILSLQEMLVKASNSIKAMVAAIQHYPYAMVYLNPHRKFILVNDAFCNWFDIELRDTNLLIMDRNSDLQLLDYKIIFDRIDPEISSFITDIYVNGPTPNKTKFIRRDLPFKHKNSKGILVDDKVTVMVNVILNADEKIDQTTIYIFSDAENQVF